MRTLILTLMFVLTSCQTTPGGNVQVGSSYPPGSCTEVGQVIGTANSREDSHNKALADLRHEAALKDGNYVRILATSAYGAAIRGMAYRCQ